MAGCGRRCALLGSMWGTAVAAPPRPRRSTRIAAQTATRAHGKNPKLHFVFPDLPDFTNAKWQNAHTKSQLADVILHGKGGMPSYKGDLEGLRVGQVVDYLRTFVYPARSSSANDPPPSARKGSAAEDPPRSAMTDPPTAANFYRNRCANCHGVDGKNLKLHVVFPDLPDFTNATWQHGHTKSQLADVILHGKGGMPSYKGDLEGLRVGQVVNYLRTFAKSSKSP